VMGSPDSDHDATGDEKPQHRVRITEPFYLGKYEVTEQQWEAVMGNSPGGFKASECPQRPASHVSWNDCQDFLRKLQEKCGNGAVVFRLPTEAQWEYACRAGTTTRYCFGDDEARLGEYAWYRDNSRNQTHPVGEKKPNQWGLYDMHGNVGEWCQDCGGAYRSDSPTDDPSGPETGSHRLQRGGTFQFAARACRSAYRYWYTPDTRLNFGFRVALDPLDASTVLAESSAHTEHEVTVDP